MRKLFFTTGSPCARAVHIVLVEKGLDFTRVETFTTPSVENRVDPAGSAPGRRQSHSLGFRRNHRLPHVQLSMFARAGRHGAPRD
jgi:hypothetical protein